MASGNTTAAAAVAPMATLRTLAILDFAGDTDIAVSS
jgi:hypothetical protein